MTGGGDAAGALDTGLALPSVSGGSFPLGSSSHLVRGCLLSRRGDDPRVADLQRAPRDLDGDCAEFNLAEHFLDVLRLKLVEGKEVEVAWGRREIEVAESGPEIKGPAYGGELGPDGRRVCLREH